MRNDTIHNSGNVQVARRSPAKTAASAGRKLHPSNRSHKGRGRNKERSPSFGATADVANGFLKCRFLAKFDGEKLAGVENEQRENNFYRSLDAVALRFGFDPSDTRSLGFPYNATLSLREVCGMLKQTGYDGLTVGLAQDTCQLSAKEHFDTGNYVYYIPVAPVYRLRTTRRTAYKLLLAIFDYLYNKAGIPYYTDSGSYMYWQYDMTFQMLQDDEESYEPEEFSYQIEDLTEAEKMGISVHQEIRTGLAFQSLDALLGKFRPRNDFDRSCREVAKKVRKLYADYPTRTVFDKADPDVCQVEEYIAMEKYVSFVSDTESWAFESVTAHIECEFNECHLKQEPTIYRSFLDDSVTENFDFEERLFSVIEEVCTLLS